MEKIEFNFPFSKVNRQRRIITGIATADNIDPSGDLVDFGASQEAFSNWIGNIREMHGKKAVGKSLSFRPIAVNHDGGVYRGIEVDAYISKGAEDTWEKVLDGTLRGFSIGGNIVEKSTEFHKDAGRNVRRITKYELGELSVVDNPGNPAAIFSLVKMADDGELEFSMEKAEYTIYYCPDDKIAQWDSLECPQCFSDMVEIGFSENFDASIVSKMIEDFELQKVEHGHKSPPKGYPQNRSQYGDPDNYKYPLDTPERIMAAMRYYNQGDQQSAGGYTDAQWKAVGRRIVTALNKLEGEIEYVLQGKKIVHKEDEEDDAGESEDMSDMMNKGDNMNLQNNVENDNVSSMELSPEQKVSVLNTFSSMLLGKDLTSGTSTTYIPFGYGSGTSTNIPNVQIYVNGDNTMSKAEETVETTEIEKSEEIVEENEENGGLDVNMEELTKAISDMFDEKLSKVKEELSASVDEKIETISKSVSEVTEKIESTTASVTEVAEKVETIDEKTAVRKSVETSESEEKEVEKVEKSSFWGGIFVPRDVIEVLGYES